MSGVGFRYPDGEKDVLTNINFNVQANEKVSIQGDDGSGKSSLLRLMSGSYDSFHGSIQINGVPLRNYNLASLRLKSGVVISQQDIFEGTLMDNICMGLEQVDMQELMQLCKITGLDEFIQALPFGFDTYLPATGRKLPTHASKKILLVRALLNKPRLLLLEEPWAGLEKNCQENIKQFLLQGLGSTTVFVITRDDAFSRACDKIILLNENGCSVVAGDPMVPGGGENV
jgi:ABC-type bacteriocin/lantibiotic exporter with double-glycine peptidase domain